MVIPAGWVEVDERVRLKCVAGRCMNYGQSATCLPYAPELDSARKAFGRFHWAVLLKKDIVPVADFADFARHTSHGLKKEIEFNEVTVRIETMAFADGYYFAMGFGLGNCRYSLCDGTVCAALDSGRCRFPFKARPSMEAVGIDVYGLVAKVGWEICPIYRSVNPALVPCASAVGLVFIY